MHRFFAAKSRSNSLIGNIAFNYFKTSFYIQFLEQLMNEISDTFKHRLLKFRTFCIYRNWINYYFQASLFLFQCNCIFWFVDRISVRVVFGSTNSHKINVFLAIKSLYGFYSLPRLPTLSVKSNLPNVTYRQTSVFIFLST